MLISLLTLVVVILVIIVVVCWSKHQECYDIFTAIEDQIEERHIEESAW